MKQIAKSVLVFFGILTVCTILNFIVYGINEILNVSSCSVLTWDRILPKKITVIFVLICIVGHMLSPLVLKKFPVVRNILNNKWFEKVTNILIVAFWILWVIAIIHTLFFDLCK